MASTDRFIGNGNSASSPATRSAPIVPNDAAELANLPKAIYVGTAGTVVGRLLDDTADRSFKLSVGYHPLRFKLIKATGTTAADMIALD